MSESSASALFAATVAGLVPVMDPPEKPLGRKRSSFTGLTIAQKKEKKDKRKRQKAARRINR